MTEPTSPNASSPASAGWYPDPAGTHLQRWWDGSAWTERTYDPISAASAPGVYANAGPEVKVLTPWVWIIAVLPAISLIVLLTIDYRQYLLDSIAVQSTPGSIPELPASFGVQLGIGALSWGVFLVSVLLAFFDWRALTRQGVQKPFHWAWAFLFVIVYVIGRPVVLKRRGRSAFSPMWVYLAIYATTIIVTFVKIADALPAVISRMSSLT